MTLQNTISRAIASMSSVIDMSVHGESVCVTFQDFTSIIVTPDKYGTYTWEMTTLHGTQVITDMDEDTVIDSITAHDVCELQLGL